MSQTSDLQQTPSHPRRWFQFSLRAALWVMVTLAVALGWLSDRVKLQQQIAQRAENDALRAARDFSSQDAGLVNPWDVSGWHYPLVTSAGEPDEATVEHLKEYLGSEPIYVAGLGGGIDYGGTGYGGSTAIFRGDSILSSTGWGVPSVNFYPTLSSPVWPAPTVRCVQDVAAKDPSSIPALVKLLQDNDATMRARAACTLARLGPNAKEAAPGLVECLKDADTTVRFHAAYALGRIRDTNPEVIAALREAMDDDRSTVAPFAAQMLQRLDPNIDIAPRLIELLDHREAETRRRAVAALAAQGSPAAAQPAAVVQPANAAAAMPKLKKLCTDPDAATCKQAMNAITRLASPADAHAILGEIVRAGPGADKEVWTFASLLWNRLDRQVRAAGTP